jgi:phosphate transport system permease protein
VTATVSPEKAGPDTKPPTTRRGDRTFAAITRLAAFTILAVLVAVFVFLAVEGWSGLTSVPATYAPFTSFVTYIWPRRSP